MLIAFLLTAGLLFNSIFQIDKKIPLPPEIRVSAEKTWTYYSYCVTNTSGTRLFLIDPITPTIKSVSLPPAEVSTVSRPSPGSIEAQFYSTDSLEDFDYHSWVATAVPPGRHSNQVSRPLALGQASDDNVLISDVGNRRVLIMDGSDSITGSFLLSGAVSAPHELRILPNGNIVSCAHLTEKANLLNSGYEVVLFSPVGEILHSFAFTPAVAVERNLWLGVAAVMDIDDAGLVYLAFSVEGIIYVYSGEGKPLRELGGPPEWFVPPDTLPPPILSVEKEPRDFWESWTRVIKLLYIGDNKILLVALTNDKVTGTNAHFILDIYGTDGKLVHKGIASEYLPVGKDGNGFIYWLSVSGDELLRTDYRGENQ